MAPAEWTTVPTRSLTKLGRAADDGDDAAMYELIDIAAELGVDPNDYATWSELAAYAAEHRRPPKKAHEPPAIRTEQLSKTYGKTPALVSLDLEVPKGEVLGYLGPNGAGKTTTIRLLLGLIKPTSGRAEIFGIDTERDPVVAHKRVAYVPGEVNLWPSLTGMESLYLLGRIHGAVDISYRDELIERFDLDPSKKVRAYSKGNRQKLILIAGLMTRADLLLLDEPTAGLDPLMERAFRECIAEAKENGQTVFLSSHILSEVEALCDRIAILRAGQLVEVGTLEQMRHLTALQVEAHMDGRVPDISKVPGVRDVVVDGKRIRCQVTGSMEPLLKVLAKAGVKQLTSREPSLEELFLAHYGSTDAHTEA
jgi:ABC-2 type transport system ATP-binding protein